MLTSLRIRNLALIDDIEIPLQGGLTVLTGETGAGKSVIVGALGLILGDRASSEVVREGHREAEVEALFELELANEVQARLDEMGLADEDGVLIVRRVVSRSGRNRVYLNGRLATLSDLKSVVGPLVDISSQHAHTSLLKVGEHRAILDRFGELREPLDAYAAAFAAWSEGDRALRRLQAAEADRAERIDFLRFQIDEIEAIAPRPGEEAELEHERGILSNAVALLDAADRAEHVLYGKAGSVVDELGDVERALRGVSGADPVLDELAERVEAARIDVEDIGQDARRYQGRVHADPVRLVEVEERIEVLRKLMRRHGPDLEDVIRRADELAAELGELDNLDHALAELQRVATTRRRELDQRAGELTRARRRTATRAAELVEEQLSDLGMPGASFLVDIQPESELGPAGGDRVEFLLSPNRGEGPKPLARIASGGELSRIMLALKHVMAAADTVDCYIFDEVDTGVSGAVGERIGVKLSETARSRQVLCITHLPQVACHADQQLRVEKTLEGDRTVTRVSSLDRSERTEEIARLLAGLEVTDRARAHAADLLAKAGAR